MLRFIKIWWPTLLTLAVVLYATLWPDPAGAEQVNLFPGADKLVHAIMMGGLASAIMFDRRRAGHKLYKHYIVAVGLVVVAFSAFLELAQQAMGLGRTLDWFDFIADVVGVVVASFAAPPVINRIFRRKK